MWRSVLSTVELCMCTIYTVSNMSKRKKSAYATQSITGYFAKKSRIGKLKFRHIVKGIN